MIRKIVRAFTVLAVLAGSGYALSALTAQPAAACAGNGVC